MSTRPAPDLVPEALGVPDLRKASELNETPTSRNLVPIEPRKTTIVFVKPYFWRCDNACACWQQVITMYLGIPRFCLTRSVTPTGLQRHAHATCIPKRHPMLAIYMIQYRSTTFSPFTVTHHRFARRLDDADDHNDTSKCRNSPSQVRLPASLAQLHVAKRRQDEG